jgi:hypothetical protein
LTAAESGWIIEGYPEWRRWLWSRPTPGNLVSDQGAPTSAIRLGDKQPHGGTELKEPMNTLPMLAASRDRVGDRGRMPARRAPVRELDPQALSESPEVLLPISEPEIGYQDRVLVTLRPASCSCLLVGAVVRRWRVSDDSYRYTVVLDSPAEDGRCMVDASGGQLLLLGQS